MKFEKFVAYKLNSLPTQTQQIIKMRATDGSSYQKIAGIFGLSTQEVWHICARYSVVLHDIRKEFNRREVSKRRRRVFKYPLIVGVNDGPL